MDHSSHHAVAPATTFGSSHSMPGMDHGDMCSMNMLFTWNWKNTCVVFKWWHIKTFPGFLLSVLAIVLFTAGYELLKAWFNRWQKSYVNTITGASATTSDVAIRRYTLKRSLFYGVQVGYSFLLMLVFMTYNGWLMLAVAVGAAIGNYFWGGIGSESVSGARDLSCH
ncbi:Ctr copper transporter family-domain-containing protein [Scheffersomyces xylosifermentans]|uniref:Ctr copper transporter family-domain-containing protein n=1 Tax=Scheffersomyces xylosifermentans TaxID=1304137 RepID=UPI00315D71C1